MSISSGELTLENAKLKQTLDELKKRIADKNHHINRGESEKKELEIANIDMKRKAVEMQQELKRAKEQIQRLSLRETRGAPYYQMISEHFPDKLELFTKH